MLNIEIPKSLQPVIDLAGQVVIAMLAFVVIAAAAMTLNLITDVAEARHLGPSWLMFGMRGLEMFVYGLDLVCCVGVMIRDAVKFLRSLLDDQG